MKGIKITSSQKKEMGEMYKTGMKLAEIAQKMDIAEGTVCRRLRGESFYHPRHTRKARYIKEIKKRLKRNQRWHTILKRLSEKGEVSRYQIRQWYMEALASEICEVCGDNLGENPIKFKNEDFSGYVCSEYCFDEIMK